MSITSYVNNGVCTIEIARPEKKNAITVSMYQAMADALSAAVANTEVRAVLIIGQPSVFTAGNDLEDFLATPPQGMDAPVFVFMRALMNCDKPVVAAVRGAAIGIGTTMLLHCDFVYVADDARLAMPFVALGIVPEFASSLIVPQLMGNVQAAEKLLLGEAMRGAEAVSLGIANAVLPAAEVVGHARQIAERFNALPPDAVRETKKLLRRHRLHVETEAIGIEGNLLIQRLHTPEAQEAFDAFLQKRKPNFKQA